MRNFKMLLQYEGTRYQGWQKQTGTDNTIQGKLETLLFKMTGKKTEVQGSGRTDAGVHALGQVANFHVNTKMGVDEMMEYMNFYLPDDIAVISLVNFPYRGAGAVSQPFECQRQDLLLPGHSRRRSPRF